MLGLYIRQTGRGALLAALAIAAVRGQSLEVYSEFQRVDPFGKIVAADRGLRSREILSPAAPRNGFLTLHIALTLPAKSSYFLYIIPNPMNACRVFLYKEHFVKTAAAWVPDTLEEVERLPYFGVMPDPAENIPGQNTRDYLLDLWIPPDADTRGFRLEVQVKVGYWMVKPMEVRILPARVPELRAKGSSPPLPRIEEGADAAAVQALAAYVAGTPLPPEREPRTVRAIIRRNAIQDMALAGSLAPQAAGPEVLRKLWGSLRTWNENPLVPRTLGAEWYLRIRDFIHARSPR